MRPLVHVVAIFTCVDRPDAGEQVVAALEAEGAVHGAAGVLRVRVKGLGIRHGPCSLLPCPVSVAGVCPGLRAGQLVEDGVSLGDWLQVRRPPVPAEALELRLAQS
jgi:hypothetical protein